MHRPRRQRLRSWNRYGHTPRGARHVVDFHIRDAAPRRIPALRRRSRCDRTACVSWQAKSANRHRGSRVMAKIATQQTIGDYAKWRAGFDKAAPFREKAGMKNVQIYRDADDPSAVLIWSEVDDIAKARAILDSPELRNAMHEAGVVGP